jgi:hypothetical protein
MEKTGKELQLEIRKLDWNDLERLFTKRKDQEIRDEWGEGKFFEYAIIRAFELEGADVRYSYNVPFFQLDKDNRIVEQIDGVVYIDGLTAVIESKDYSSKNNVDIEPLAKLQVRLKRRPPQVIGCLFTASDFTWPAQALIETLMPQTILLWNKNDIEHCFKYHCFINGLKLKYKSVVEDCNHILDLSTVALITNNKKLTGKPQ